MAAFEDVPAAALSNPPLTCVRQPRDTAGMLGLDLLHDRIEGLTNRCRAGVDSLQPGSMGLGRRPAHRLVGDGVNVVVILIDTLRRDYLSPYGSTRVATPHFQCLAATGTTVDRAYLTSYPCMPARRDLGTGRYEFSGRGWGPLQTQDRPLPEVLSHTGIRTGLVTDHYHPFEHGAGNYQFGALPEQRQRLGLE